MKKSFYMIAQITIFFFLISQLQSCQLFKKAQTPTNQPPAVSTIEEEEEGAIKSQINIRIPINSKTVFINGQSTPLNSPPAYIDENSVTMVPLGFISEIIGAKLEWIPDSKTIIISLDTKEIKLQINSYIALVNLKEEQLISPPQIKEERTFVPLKFIAQNLGFNTKWIAETKSINLTK